MLAPVEVVEIELGDALPRLRPAPGARSGAARALVRLHGRPLGLVDLPLAPGGLSPDGCARLIWSELRAEIAAHLAGDGLAPVTALTADGLPTARGPAPCAAAHGAARARGRTEPVSVVIATRDRPGPLARCLASVARLDHPAFEVIVVDNAPATTATRDLVAREHPEVRYVRENRPGLAAAHNRGLAEAGGAIVAITDDDVTVDPRWLLEIAAGFARDPRIGCVTGLILPAELRTPAQVWADRHWGVAKGFRERLYTRPLRHLSVRPYPYTAGCFGSGANMAFRTATLRALHGFDPGMGTGRPRAAATTSPRSSRSSRRATRSSSRRPRSSGTGTPRTSTPCAARRTATAPASPRTSRRSSPTIPIRLVDLAARSACRPGARSRTVPVACPPRRAARGPEAAGAPRHGGRCGRVHARPPARPEDEGRVTWLHDDVDTLAAALTDSVARGDDLDAFLAAAAMLQIAEDATDGEPALLLHAAGRFASGGGWPGRGAAATTRAAARRAGDVAARRRPPGVRAWAGTVGEVVALLADRVAGVAASLGRGRGCGARTSRCGPPCARRATAWTRLPDPVRRAVARQPAVLPRRSTSTPTTSASSSPVSPGSSRQRDRPLLVAGVRTSGVYLAPLAAAALRAIGYRDVRVITLRPHRRLRADQRAAVRSVAARGGLGLVCDDPPASGSAVGAVAGDLARRGLDVVLLLAVFGDREALPPRLRDVRFVLLPERDWAVTARLEPARVRAAVAALLAPGADVVACEPLTASGRRPERGPVRRAYRIGIRVAGTGSSGR